MKNKAVFLPISFLILIIIGCNGPKNEKEKEQKNLEATSKIAPSIVQDTIEESPEEKRFYELTNSLQGKYEAGKLKEVTSSISEIQKLLPKYEDNWNYGNAVHKINIVAGRMALQEGKIDEAKKYLIAAGKTKGSPQLNSFGPNMTLAKELLEKGEKDVVLQYFDLCSIFWKSDYSSLKQWKAIVQKGAIPDFGANLKF